MSSSNCILRYYPHVHLFEQDIIVIIKLKKKKKKSIGCLEDWNTKTYTSSSSSSPANFLRTASSDKPFSYRYPVACHIILVGSMFCALVCMCVCFKNQIYAVD